MSEVAPSVGGGAAIGPQRATEVSGIGAAVDPAALLLRRVMQASRDLDPIALQSQLDLGASVLGLDRCVDDILMPAMRQSRTLLAAGQHDAAQDLMATEAVRSWLNHRRSSAPKPQNIGPILLSCGPRDRQVVVLESLALLLRFRRWPCQVLGARVSTFTLTIAAQAAAATGVVVASADGRGLQHAIISLRAVAALGVPVFFAGDAFAADADREQLPGQYLGTRLERACDLLISSLQPKDPGKTMQVALTPPRSGPARQA